MDAPIAQLRDDLVAHDGRNGMVAGELGLSQAPAEDSVAGDFDGDGRGAGPLIVGAGALRSVGDHIAQAVAETRRRFVERLLGGERSQALRAGIGRRRDGPFDIRLGRLEQGLDRASLTPPRGRLFRGRLTLGLTDRGERVTDEHGPVLVERQSAHPRCDQGGRKKAEATHLGGGDALGVAEHLGGFWLGKAIEQQAIVGGAPRDLAQLGEHGRQARWRGDQDAGEETPHGQGEDQVSLHAGAAPIEP